MKKTFLFTVSVCCLVTFIFTVYYAKRIYQSNMIEQMESEVVISSQSRIAIITQELETPFAKALKLGAERFAKDNGISVNFWGTYHPNLNELLKYMDIAIASKVDGIIVQAMDGPEFIQKVEKASEKGIPVITVGLDSPDSLRKTYVGPDHFIEGETIASLLVNEMNGQGKVCIVSANKLTSFEKLRLEGVRHILSTHPSIRVIAVEAGEGDLNQPQKVVKNILNQYPDLKVFIGLNAEAGVGIEQALRERSRFEENRVYTFDDTPELLDMVNSGFIVATLTNDGTVIGERSVSLMRQWIQNINLPLPRNEYTEVTLYNKKGSL